MSRTEETVPGTGESPAVAPARPRDHDDDLLHYSCCVPPPRGPRYALCGRDLMDDALLDDFPPGVQECPTCRARLEVAGTAERLCVTVCPKLTFG